MRFDAIFITISLISFQTLRLVDRGEMQQPRSKAGDPFRDHSARGDITMWLHKGHTETLAASLVELMRIFEELQADLSSIIQLAHMEGEHQVRFL